MLLHAYRGQTVGKKYEHVKVLDVSEQRIPSLKQAVLRDIGSVVASSVGLIYILYLLAVNRYKGPEALTGHWFVIVLGSANLVWFVLEIVTMLTNSKRRALHDLIAGTVVVRVE